MCLALGTPFEVSGTVHMHAGLAERFSDQEIANAGASVTAIRVENFPASARYRSSRLKQMLQAYAPALELDTARSRIFWDEVRTLKMFQKTRRPLWRISTLPSDRAEARQRRSRARSTSASLYDWSGGLIWLETPPISDAGAVEIRRTLAEFGGHATLIRAEAAARAGIDVFQPLDPPLMALTALAQARLRSGRNSQSRPHVSRDLGERPCRPISTHVQLADPTIARADAILRRCVHCGLCTATCPTYVLTGDERDSPRGRIYLMKQMFEEREVTPSMTYHIDRCLSCFSCMTTCPSGVDYMHLVDLARDAHRDEGPPHAAQRALRWILSKVLPNPRRFRLALMLGWLARPFRGLIARAGLRAARRRACARAAAPAQGEAHQSRDRRSARTPRPSASR